MALVEALTTYGIIGVKVWICRGEYQLIAEELIMLMPKKLSFVKFKEVAGKACQRVLVTFLLANMACKLLNLPGSLLSRLKRFV